MRFTSTRRGARLARLLEVSDARGERLPATPDAPPPTGAAESGHGLLLVEEFALKWGVADRSIGKTVWAVCALNCTDERVYSP